MKSQVGCGMESVSLNARGQTLLLVSKGRSAIEYGGKTTIITTTKYSSPTDSFSIIHTYISCKNLLLTWHSAHPLQKTNVTKVTVEMNALLPYYLQMRCYRHVAKYCSFSSRSVIMRSIGCCCLCYSHMNTKTVTP